MIVRVLTATVRAERAAALNATLWQQLPIVDPDADVGPGVGPP